MKLFKNLKPRMCNCGIPDKRCVSNTTFIIRGVIEHGDYGVRVKFNNDLVRYWNWLFFRSVGIKIDNPRFGAKISLYNSHINTKEPNLEKLDKWDGKQVDICVNVSHIIYNVSKAGFPICLLSKIECDKLWYVIEDLELEENFDEYRRPHMTISNGKSKQRTKPRVRKRM